MTAQAEAREREKEGKGKANVRFLLFFSLVCSDFQDFLADSVYIVHRERERERERKRRFRTNFNGSAAFSPFSLSYSLSLTPRRGCSERRSVIYDGRKWEMPRQQASPLFPSLPLSPLFTFSAAGEKFSPGKRQH
jgi:hypothetical protein